MTTKGNLVWHYHKLSYRRPRADWVRWVLTVPTLRPQTYLAEKAGILMNALPVEDRHALRSLTLSEKWWDE